MSALHVSFGGGHCFRPKFRVGAGAVFSSRESRDSGLSCPYKPVTGGWILTGDREQEPTFLPEGVKRVGGKEDYKPHLEGVVRRRRSKLTVVINKCVCACHRVMSPTLCECSVRTRCWVSPGRGEHSPRV